MAFSAIINCSFTLPVMRYLRNVLESCTLGWLITSPDYSTQAFKIVAYRIGPVSYGVTGKPVDHCSVKF